MRSDPNRDLLERATVALERQEHALEQMMRRMDERDVEAAVRYERLTERFDRSERRIVSVLGDIDVSINRSNEAMTARLDDMGAAIRANTQAVLAMLDRLPPATA